MAKAPLTITGQDLSLSVGDAIPDLNYTVTGWKHSDASLAIRANPASLNSLKLWLDASDSSTITHTSNAVSQWSDKSGNAYHATASSDQPTTGSDSINGKNVITLGSDKKISSATPSSANWQDVYIVARWDGGSTFNNYNGLFTGTSNVNGDIGIIGNSGTADLYSSNWFDNIYLNGSSSSTSTVLGTMSSNFIVSVSANSSVSVGGYLIGNDRTNANRNWIGVIGEVIAFGEKLSDTNRQKIEGYLAHKWGLSGFLAQQPLPQDDQLNSRPLGDHRCHQFQQCGYLLCPPERCPIQKIFFHLCGWGSGAIQPDCPRDCLGSEFHGVGVGQTVDLNASATSGLAVLYSVSDTSVAELAVTNQSSLQAWYKLDETSGDAVRLLRIRTPRIAA